MSPKGQRGGSRLLRQAGAVALGLLLLAPGSARATQEIRYRWQTPRVTVTWAEGNSTPLDPALLRQVGHWKRVAHTLWTQKPSAPRLEMEVSFFDERIGSDGPIVRLKAGKRTAMVTAPLTEKRVAAALLGVRDGATGSAEAVVPDDDTEGRVSSTGEWIAGVSWRGGRQEIWLVPPVPKRAFRVPFPDEGPVQDQLILTPPRWAPQGRLLAWVQGGRLVLFEGRRQKGQFLTPKGRQVTDFEWSPFGNQLLVLFDDETIQLLDLRSSRALSLTELLREAPPQGKLFWAPSGRRLLFRTRSGVVTADLSPPRPPVNAVDRFLNRLVGEPEPPKPEQGPVEERLAVLDLAGQRLDAYSIAGTPLADAELTGTMWSAAEDEVHVVAAPAGDAQRLVRFRLRKGAAAQVLLRSPEPLRVLGRRDDSGNPSYALLRGTRVYRVSGDTVEPYPAEATVELRLAAGPAGGYSGTEGAEITEDEPARWVVLEDFSHAGRMSARRRFEEGLWASVEPDSPTLAALRQAVTPETVDFDLFSVPGKEVAVLTRSPDGGVSELVGFSAERVSDPGTPPESFSRRLSEAKELKDVPPADEPFKVVDPRQGLEAFALRYHTLSGRRMLIAGAAIALLVAGLVLSRRGRRRV